MKKIVLVMLLLSLSNLGQAQKVRWGAKAGYNLSNFSGDYNGIDYVSGFHFGGLADLKLSLKFGLQTELLYSREGGQYSFEINEPPFLAKASEKVTLGYINLPIMLKYYAIDGLTFEAGPQIGVLVSGKSDYQSTVTINGETIEDSGSIDLKDKLNAISYGFNLGIGYELQNQLFFQARYHIGLANISKDNSTNNEEDPVGLNPDRLRNQGFQFSVGYKF